MQDSTVLVSLSSDNSTLKLLRTDSKASYASGAWEDNVGKSLVAKDNFASAVLPDDRLVTCGGEQSGRGNDTNLRTLCDNPRVHAHLKIIIY